MLYLFKRAYRRVKRFILWFPIIWRDEDWDHAYLYEIMRFKISQMRKSFVKNDRHTTVNETVKTMRVVEQLLSRLGFSDFYYDQEERNNNVEKSGICTCPDVDFMWEDLGNDMHAMKSLRCAFCEKHRKRWYKRDAAKQKADQEYLFKYLNKHVRKWWD